MPCVAPLIINSPCPPSLLCLWGPFQCRGWLGGSKAAAWGRPGQTQARYNAGWELYLCRAPLGLTACTRGTPKPPAAHQQLLSLLTEHPKDVWTRVLGGPSAMWLQASRGSEAGRVAVVLRPGLPGVLRSSLSL